MQHLSNAAVLALFKGCMQRPCKRDNHQCTKLRLLGNSGVMHHQVNCEINNYKLGESRGLACGQRRKNNTIGTLRIKQ